MQQNSPQTSTTNSPPPPSFTCPPVVQRTYDFYKILHIALVKIPKVERYTIGQTVNQTALSMLKNLLAASRMSGGSKIELLHQAGTELETLKLLIRLLLDLKALNSKKYLELQGYLQEIGRMLGGWIKHFQQTKS